ncbi:hypothetical protein GCM10017750_00700 [Streptomyces racemochromogenes]
MAQAEVIKGRLEGRHAPTASRSERMKVPGGVAGSAVPRRAAPHGLDARLPPLVAEPQHTARLPPPAALKPLPDGVVKRRVHIILRTMRNRSAIAHVLPSRSVRLQ